MKRKAGATPNFVGFRAFPDLLAFLDARRRPREALGSAARECLERYRILLAHGREELQSLRLTEKEALQVLEILNEAFFTLETIHLLWLHIADRMGNEHPLTTKIRSLSPAGCFALMDIAERFWRGAHEALWEIIQEEPR